MFNILIKLKNLNHNYITVLIEAIIIFFNQVVCTPNILNDIITYSSNLNNKRFIDFWSILLIIIETSLIR
jgi:hypothetical protein